MKLNNLLRLLSVLALSAVAYLGIGLSPLGANNSSYVPPIDTSNRAQVASTYRTAVAGNLALNSGWNGSTSDCRPGSASDSYDAATIESINWFRRMSGLSIVTEDSSASIKAQQTALMMHAQNNLSHYPTPSWRCHTKAGASLAAESNLTLGVVGPRGVIGQIEDPGAGNEALGHRRWLLFPELESVGVANTSRASVVRVLGEFGERESKSNWISWPPPGFVPDETIFDRWSISFAGTQAVDFSSARVQVRENGRSVSVRLLPLSHGFGDPTLAWDVSGIQPKATGDVKYTVDVSNVKVGGRSVNRSYSFTSFDVDGSTTSTTTTNTPRCNGKPATILGTSGDDHLRGTPGADVIVALGGNDRIDGLGGNDIICAGAGADVVRAGWGNDVVFGGGGKDLLLGSRGNDALYGQGGRDDLRGGSGADTLVGGKHLDVFTGGSGNDVCWGSSAGQRAVSADRRTGCERGR
jgi:uncharacterized protein YkwD